MEDYGGLVYLDLQKSGSSFIAHILEQLLGPDERRRRSNHGRIRRQREDTIYFTSVRHPLELYGSLYRFGCDRRGTLAKRFRRLGLGDFYDGTEAGFLRWLDFVLDPAHAEQIGEGYERVPSHLFGLQTFRFMVLSVARPVLTLMEVDSREALDALYDDARITSFVVRNEMMNEDLLRFFREYVPDRVDMTRAEALLAAAPRVNASQTTLPARLSPPLAARLRAREAFLFDRFYPDSDAALAPQAAPAGPHRAAPAGRAVSAR